MAESLSLLARAIRKHGVDAVANTLPLEQLAGLWEAWARPEQLEPPGDWLVWLILAGRSWGKSRTGAETVRKWAMQHPGCHIALVARTAADVRDVMVKAVLTPWRGGHLNPKAMPRHESSNRALVWPNGSRATTYSAEEPDQLRGPQHDFAWADELAAWQYREEAWDEGLKMGLRGSGQPGVYVDRPRVIVTTTPRPIPIVRRLLKDPYTVAVRGRTSDNANNLPRSYLDEMQRKYAGTRIGRQELDGELLEDVEGALWTHDLIDRCRVKAAPPQLTRVVVALDPAGSGKANADEAGIVAVGVAPCACKGAQRVEEHAFVLEDSSGTLSGEAQTRRVIAAYKRHGANRVVVEVNFGGDYVPDLIRVIDPSILVEVVRATRGKLVRAEPAAALYEQGRVHHVGGNLRELEDECCTFTPFEPSSPGRMDALVWALYSLKIGEAPASFGGKKFTGPAFTFAIPDAHDDWDDK